MQRYEDWPARFHAEIKAARERPFSWGTQDCALFSCNMVLALTGADLAAWFRGRYTTAIGAVQAIQEFTDGGDLEAVAERISREHLVPEIAPAYAQRGDIVLADLQSGPTLGVAVDHRTAFASLQGGLDYRPLSACRRSWRI